VKSTPGHMVAGGGGAMEQNPSDTTGNQFQDLPTTLPQAPAEGSRKLRFPDFMTTAHDDGKVVSLAHRPPLPLGNTPGIHFC